MEHSQKNTDCYFFYYSTCIKGDNCAFRHEPSALGCETMCTFWQQGNCLNEHCNFRHMELKKNRKLIPCYWETQPSGCRKPHCSFMHKNARTITTDPINPVKNTELTPKPVNQEWSNRPDDGKYDGSSTESDQGRGSSEAGSFIGSPAVDPLIVNFEEESDNESVPSPVKPQTRVPYCKTYEEIRLEEIQAESAAYYSYEPDDYLGNIGGGKVKRTARGTRTVSLYSHEKKAQEGEPNTSASTSLNFEVLSLEQIRKRRQGAERTRQVDEKEDARGSEVTHANSLNIAIKTLAELRASKATKQQEQQQQKRQRQMIVSRGTKRALELTVSESDADDVPVRSVKLRLDVKVPPVRLRRSPNKKALSRLDKDKIDSVDRGEEIAERREDNENVLDRGEFVQRRPSRLSGSSDETDGKENSKQDEIRDESACRSGDVEVRLCDSSTDASREQDISLDDQLEGGSSEQDEIARRMSGEYDEALRNEETNDEFKASHSGKAGPTCDSLLSVSDDDYLMLDAASDDILKDIDAILKEKSTV